VRISQPYRDSQVCIPYGARTRFASINAPDVSRYSMAPFLSVYLFLDCSPAVLRAVRRRHWFGGGAPVNFGRRRRCAAGPKKSAAAVRRQRFPKNFVLSSKLSDDLFCHRKLQQKKYTAKMYLGAPTNYRRRRADQKKSAAAPTNCRRRRRATGARLYRIPID